jgi:hypothetical protein
MSKLTLSVRPTVVSSAKRYAKQRGVSISQMVEIYLAAVSQPAEPTEIPPILRSLRGLLKTADVQSYRQHLSRKYR